nr:reverse transcriptase domain-containing protein [Tanacetum cinerariifolium]
MVPSGLSTIPNAVTRAATIAVIKATGQRWSPTVNGGKPLVNHRWPASDHRIPADGPPPVNSGRLPVNGRVGSGRVNDRVRSGRNWIRVESGCHVDQSDRAMWHVKVVTPAPIKAVEESYVNCGGPHAHYNCDAINSNQPSVCVVTGRSFLRTGRGLIYVYGEEITLRVNDKAVTFNLNQTTRYYSTYDDLSVNRIDIIDVAREEYAQEILEIDHADCDPEGDILLIEKLLNNDSFQLPSMDLKQGEVVKAKSSIEEPPKLELKDLPSHLEYAYLE